MRLKIIFVFIFLFFIFASNALENKYILIEDKSDLVILNPLLKDRKTLKLRLSNGLKVYIISDKNADKSAAAIGVLAGSWDDPKEFPGMAHFCEHMLFQGSKKYPNESDYFKFIWDNSGTLNAFTASDRTVYMFSINHENFDAALDRLSHFFKDPIFDPSNIARELFAVDQEHSKNIENDARRIYMVSKEIYNQKHPKAKFSTGNSKTLQSIPPAELRKWYETHYSSNQMAITIYSNLDLNVLQKMIVEKFSQIPNIGKDLLNIEEKIFSDENVGKMVYIKPISNLQILAIEWELDKKFTTDETKSAELIAYTLTRGQKYSLLENLKKEYLAEDLEVSVDKVGSNQSLLSIEVKLTDFGLQNISKIINRCFEAINNLKTSSIPSYLFHEMQSMAKLNYEYQSHEDAFEFVSSNTINLLDEDISTYPKKTLLANHYSSENVLQILNSFTFSNAQFYLIADPKKTKIPLDKKEKWMKAEYTIKDLSNSLKNSLSKNLTNSNIKLPEPNPFIPSNVQIVTPKDNPTSPTNPAKIVSSDFGTVYYLKDDQYQVPQVSYLFQIKDKVFNGSTKAEVLKDIYVKALKEKLSPTFFSARAAGLFPNITTDPYHLKIEIFGYSQKASYLLEEILKEINNFEISKDDFDIYYSSINKTYENNRTLLPVLQAHNYLYHVLVPSTSTFESKLETLKTIHYKDFIEFKNKLLKNTFIEGFLSGNLTLKQAESIWLDVKDILGQKPFYPKDHYKKEVFVISENTGPYYIHKKLPLLGNGVILALDQCDFSFKNRAAQNILSQMLKEAFFTSLRSKQKTAYIARSTDIELERHLYQLFLVQSNSHEVKDLLARFEIFLENFLEDLDKNAPKDRFENVKNSVLDNLKNPYKNLEEMSDKLNHLAFEYNADFLWYDKRIKALNDLTYEEFLVFSKQSLSRDNKKRIAILFEGKIDKNFKYKKLHNEKPETIGFYKTRLDEIISDIEIN